MFERFSSPLREVLVSAGAWAGADGSVAVDVDHLARALDGAPEASARSASAWTPAAKVILEAALRVSLERGARTVTPDDLRTALADPRLGRTDAHAEPALSGGFTHTTDGTQGVGPPPPALHGTPLQRESAGIGEAPPSCVPATARGALEGVGHRQLVEVLLSGYETVTRIGEPVWFSLEANPGWGKTRVVQEFYARLAERQSSPPYWPPSIVGPEEVGITARRKLVHPPRGKAAGDAQLEWFWWGISCAFRDGLPISALVQDLQRFSERRSALERRMAGLSTKSRRAKRSLRKHREELAEVAVEEAVATSLLLAGAVVPGLSLLSVLSKWGVGRIKRLGAEPPAGELLDDIVPALAEFARAGIPLILFVEDLHDADDTLASLLMRLLAIEQAPIMIITTAWRGVLEQRDRPTSQLCEKVTASQWQRVDCERELPQLTVHELGRVVSTHIPFADTASCELLAETYRNPYELEIACCFGAVQRAARRGTLTPADLEGLPSGLMGLIRHLWAELPYDVRLGLGIASALTPETISADYGFRDARWNNELLHDVIQRVPWLTEELPSPGDAFERAHEQYGWVTAAGEGLHRFTDPTQLAAARESFAAEYGHGREWRDLLTGAAEVAESMIDPLSLIADDTDRSPTNVDRLLVALTMEGWTPWSPSVGRAAQRICEGILAAPGAADLDAIQRICVAGATAEEVWFDQMFSFHVALGRCLLEKRDGEGAAEQFAAVLDALESAGWPATSDAVLIRANLSAALEAAERREEALEQLEPAQQYLNDVFGLGTPESRWIRVMHTRLLGDLGRRDEAITGLEELEREAITICGPGSVEALDARVALLVMRDESDQSSGVDQLRDVLSQYIRVAGPLALETLGCREALGGMLFSAGHYAEAAEQCESVMLGLTCVLGPNAPTTLTARCAFGLTAVYAGKTEQARQTLADAVVDSRRELGSNARTTIIAQVWLCVAEGLAGDKAQAANRIRDLEPTIARNAGPDSDLARSVRHVVVSLDKHGRLPQPPSVHFHGPYISTSTRRRSTTSTRRRSTPKRGREKPGTAIQWPVVKPNSSPPKAQADIACALANDGLTLTRLGRDEHALSRYEELLRRFENADEPRTQIAVAMGLAGKGAILFGAGKQKSALLTIDQLAGRFASHYNSRARRAAAQGLMYKGATLTELEHHDQALSTYESVLELFTNDSEPAIREGVVAVALVGRAIALLHLGQFDGAISQFDKIATEFEQAPDQMARTQSASAIFNKGVAFCQVHRTEDGIRCFDDILARFGDAHEQGLRGALAGALLQKGVALTTDTAPTAGVVCYEEIIDRFSDDQDSDIQQQVARAHMYLGLSLARDGRLSPAVEHFSIAERHLSGIDPRDTRRITLLTRAQSRLGLANALALIGRITDAIATLDDCPRLKVNKDDPEFRAVVQEAKHLRSGLEAEFKMYAEGKPSRSGVRSAADNAHKLLILSKILRSQGRSDDAATLCQLVVDRLSQSRHPTLATLVYDARLNQAHAYDAAKDHERALAAYDQLAGYARDPRDHRLGDLVLEAVVGKAEQLKTLGRLEDAVATLEEITPRSIAADQRHISEVTVRALVSKAHLLEVVGRTNDAASTYRDLAAGLEQNRDPSNLPHLAFALVRAGRIAIQTSEYETALSWFLQAIRRLHGAESQYLKRSLTEAQFGQVESLLRLEKPRQALDELSALSEALSEPTDPSAAMLLARSLALRAWALNGVERHTEALTAARRAAGIQTESDSQSWRVVRSESSLQAIAALGALNRIREQRTDLAEMTSIYREDTDPQVRGNLRLATELATTQEMGEVS